MLAALLLVVPFFAWARLSLFAFPGDVGSTSTDVTTQVQGLTEEAEWESAREVARPAPRTRLRDGRRLCVPSNADERRAAEIRHSRFKLVVDVRRVKPKRQHDPPYLRPRVVRLLS
ncbi:MAG: hypothetical protein IPM54_09025 [Polyangiaceae bacterium]|nr:hypothetical protein [Polyangiaceae bacterium]